MSWNVCVCVFVYEFWSVIKIINLSSSTTTRTAATATTHEMARIQRAYVLEVVAGSGDGGACLEGSIWNQLCIWQYWIKYKYIWHIFEQLSAVLMPTFYCFITEVYLRIDDVTTFNNKITEVCLDLIKEIDLIDRKVTW